MLLLAISTALLMVCAQALPFLKEKVSKRATEKEPCSKLLGVKLMTRFLTVAAAGITVIVVYLKVKPIAEEVLQQDDLRK